jgi:hypothetical protein
MITRMQRPMATMARLEPSVPGDAPVLLAQERAGLGRAPAAALPTIAAR